MHLFRFGVLSTLLSGALLSCSGGSGVSDDAPTAGAATAARPPKPSNGAPTDVGESGTTTHLGRYRFSVDPTATRPLTVTALLDDTSWSERQPEATPRLGGNKSVLADVTVTGPGTWNGPPTNELRADVVLTHDGTVNDSFDEPQLVVTALEVRGPGTVRFITSDGGGTGVGAVVPFADMQSPSATPKCGGRTKTSARRELRIAVTRPENTRFDFTVDVRADRVAPNSARVVPDCDDDGYNTEPEDAGNDCNDNSRSVRSGCTCEPGPRNCTSPGLSCTQPVRPHGKTTCSGDCVCNVEARSQTDVEVACTGDCNVTCDGVSHDPLTSGTTACSSPCSGEGTDCNLTCKNQRRSANGSVANDCAQTCSDGANCNLTCTDNESNCQVARCSEGADCKVSCTGTNGRGVTSNVWAGACGVNTCAGAGTSCDVSCGEAPASAAPAFADCGVTSCTDGASCTVTCNEKSTPSSPWNRCVLGCQGSSKCTIDCHELRGDERDRCRDGLTCPRGKRPRETKPGSGIWSCDASSASTIRASLEEP